MPCDTCLEKIAEKAVKAVLEINKKKIVRIKYGLRLQQKPKEKIEDGKETDQTQSNETNYNSTN